MISIVICSTNSDLFYRVSRSIEKSIGCEYEILKVENNIKNLPIVKAYNLGGAKAKYPYLVFLHEDIVFHSYNWGVVLVNYFESLLFPGVLGIAASSYLPISPSDWWVADKDSIFMNFYSNSKGGKVGKGVLKRNGVQIPQKVYAIDGMFLAMKKNVWEEFPFDESLPGFHGYDTSVCYRISQKYQNYFIPGLLLEHFSKGSPNEIWLMNTISANKSILPFILRNQKKLNINKKLEIKSFHLFLGQLRKFHKSYKGPVKLSSFYLFKLNSSFFSLRSYLIWFYFQIIYLKKLFN